MSDKKLFIDLALKLRSLDNRLGKALMTVVWENIARAFNEITCLQYELFQFKNLFGQLRSKWQTEVADIIYWI